MISYYYIWIYWIWHRMVITKHCPGNGYKDEKGAHSTYVSWLHKLAGCRVLVMLYRAAITILCVSLLLDNIPNKKHYSNYPLDLSLNHNMPDNDEPQADGSPLTAWIKTHLGRLYHEESTVGGEESDFQAVFNSTFSENVSIYVNHKQIPRDEFESEMLASRSALSRPARIDWKEILEIPTKSEENTTSAVSFQHSEHPVLTLTLASGSPLVLPLDFSLLHAQWSSRSVLRMPKFLFITVSVHSQFRSCLYHSPSHSFFSLI